MNKDLIIEKYKELVKHYRGMLREAGYYIQVKGEQLESELSLLQEQGEEKAKEDELVKQCPALEKYIIPVTPSGKELREEPILYSIPYLSDDGERMIGEIIRLCDDIVSFDNKCFAIRQRILKYLKSNQ